MGIISTKKVNTLYDLNKKNKYSQIIYFLALLFPIFLINIKILGNFILLLIMIFGLLKVVQGQFLVFQHNGLKTLTILFLSYFLVILLSIIFNSGFSYDLMHIFRKLHFLLAPIIAIAFLGLNLKARTLIKSFKISLLILAILTITNVIHFSYYEENLIGNWSHGMINANILGDLTVTFLFISSLNFFNETRNEKILTIFSIIAAFFSLSIIHSRGSWISLILLSLVFLIYFRKEIKLLFLGNKKSFMALFGLCFAAILLIFPSIYSDFKRATLNSIEWINTPEKYSSSGIRLEMWSSSLKALKDMPWYGYGYRNANTEVSMFSEHHNDRIKKFTHLHNEFLTNLMSAGVIGLIFSLFMIMVPIIFFLKFRERSEIYASLGIFLSLSYAFNGLSHIAFGEEHVNALYVFMLAYLMSRKEFLFN